MVQYTTTVYISQNYFLQYLLEKKKNLYEESQDRKQKPDFVLIKAMKFLPVMSVRTELYRRNKCPRFSLETAGLSS